MVELIVVIAVLGVLMAVLIPQYIQYVEKSRDGVCDSNCAAVEREIRIAQTAADGSFELADAQAILDSHNGEVCPSGLKIFCEKKENVEEYVIFCIKHGEYSADIAESMWIKYQHMANNAKEFIDEKWGMNNDELRKAYYKINGNKWEEMMVDGTPYYVQPYIDASGDKPSKDLLVFANKNGALEPKNWNANLIYDRVKKQWFKAPKVNGAIMVANKSWDEVEKEMTAAGWVAVENVTYK